MALTKVTAHTSQFTTPVSQTVSGVTAGRTMILGFSTYKGIVSGITDNRSNVYTKVATAGSGNARADLFVCKAVTGGSLTITYTKTGSSPYCAGYLYEYDDLVDDPLDQFVTATGTSNSPASGNTAATTQANERIVSVVAMVSPNITVTAGSGFGNLNQQAMPSNTGRVAMEDCDVAATGPQSASFGLSVASDWAIIAATFKLAGGGGPTGPEPGRRLLLACS